MSANVLLFSLVSYLSVWLKQVVNPVIWTREYRVHPFQLYLPSLLNTT